MKKSGFTLIELLSVIIILAIVLAIAIPTISGIIKGATESAFENDAKMVLKAIEYKKLSDRSFDETTINITNIQSILNLSPVNYESITVSILDGKPRISIVGKEKWDGLIASGTFESMTVVELIATYLSNIIVSDGILQPGFIKTLFVYDLNVESSLESITITPTAEYSARVDISIAGNYINSGNPFSVPISIGMNTIRIIVKDKNSGQETPYEIRVNRAAPITTYLASLNVKIGRNFMLPTPTFEATELGYSITAAALPANINVLAVAEHPGDVDIYVNDILDVDGTEIVYVDVPGTIIRVVVRDKISGQETRYEIMVNI